MRKQVQIALVVLLVTIAGSIVWQVLRERELVYQGKTLSLWLERYITSGSVIDVVPEAEADEAVRQIGTNAIPALLRMLRARDSKLELAVVRLLNKQAFIELHLPLPAYFPTRQAATAFRALGANASNAVPRLIQTYRDKIGLDSQCGCAEALGWIGPPASVAIPDLISATTDSDSTLRWVAVEALGHIHSEPRLVVPVLTESLLDSNIRVRLRAVRSFAGFGSESKSAIPTLTRSLTDPSIIMRSDVSNALRQIDPEAAARAGVR